MGRPPVVVSDGPDNARRRGLVRPGLHRRQVAGYVGIIARTADEALDSLVPDEVVDGYEVFRSAIRRSTMRSLFGEEMATQADELGEQLQPLLALTDVLPDALPRLERLQTPGWRRAQAARRRVDSFVDHEVSRIRED